MSCLSARHLRQGVIPSYFTRVILGRPVSEQHPVADSRVLPNWRGGLLLGRVYESPVRGFTAMRAGREGLALTQCDLLGVAVVLVDA